MNVIELEFKDEKSNKFWKIEWTNDSFTVTYGKIGSNGTSKTTMCDNPEDEAKKQAKAKMKKGYVEVSGTSNQKPEMIFDEREDTVSIWFTNFTDDDSDDYFEFVYGEDEDDEYGSSSKFIKDFDLEWFDEDFAEGCSGAEPTNDYESLLEGVYNEEFILPKLDELTKHLNGEKFTGVFVISGVYIENIISRNKANTVVFAGSLDYSEDTNTFDYIIQNCFNGKELYNHAKLCVQGQGCTDKEEEIVKLLAKSKEAGYQYAFCYAANVQRDLYIKNDFSKSIKYYLYGIEHGCGASSSNLSNVYSEMKDLENTFKYRQIAFDLNYYSVSASLGYCYQYGSGTKIDQKKAFEIYKVGVENNDISATHNLAVCYRDAEGVEENLELAFKYFKIAAEADNTNAHNNLGVCYSDGKGCPVDKEKALYHYKQAFDQGSPQGATNIGDFYEEGTIYKQNSATALSFYSIAKDRGCETGAKKYAELLEKLNNMKDETPSTSSDSDSIYLEFKDDKSSKFYKVEWNDDSYTVTYGRIGADGTTKTTPSDNPESDARKQANAKIKKGYVEVDNSSNDMSKKANNVFSKLVEKGGSFIEIKPYDKENIKLTDSKFGGIPLLPKGATLPQTTNDETMMLIAQINLSKIPTGAFPIESGYLQFYIDGADDILGLDFDDQYNTDGFRVIYFEDTKDYYSEDEMEELYNPETDESPIEGEAALKFKIKNMGITPQDDKYEEMFVETWNELYPDETIEELDEIDDDILEELHDNAPSTGHRLLGYPFFTQSDPRYGDDKELILLFQIDTDSTDEMDLCIGDSGVMNFFIKKEDLDNKDFSKVFYNWDCF